MSEFNIANVQDWIDIPLGSIVRPCDEEAGYYIRRVPSGWIVNGAFIPEPPDAPRRSHEGLNPVILTLLQDMANELAFFGELTDTEQATDSAQDKANHLATHARVVIAAAKK